MTHQPNASRRPIRLWAAALWCAITLVVAALIAPSHAAADVTFKITGGGWGHGIGLSQYGAKGLAEKGWNYQQIICWYYGADKDGSSSGVWPSTLGSAGKYENPLIKVNLDADVGSERSTSTRSSWSLRGWKSRLVLKSSSGTTLTVLPKADHYYTFAYDSVVGRTRVTDPSTDKSLLNTSGTIRVTSEPTSGISPALIVVGSKSGPFNRTNVRYRREIQLSLVGSGKIRAVNILPMEEYLYGVVPRESPASWPAAALQAQAIAARSYAWASNPPDTATSTSLPGILLCTVYSQVYHGHSRIVREGGVDKSIQYHEDSRTNAAVNATRARVVYHKPTKKVVQAFFSSSSGGHTANIEDVWYSSSPQPYYKGVTDYDQSNPNFRWTAVAKTGAQLADMLRAKDDNAGARHDYTVPAPATIIAVTHDRAPSGYVRGVRFRWSNGQSFVVNGTTVQSALGLKSTKFTISGPTWSPMLQETHSYLAWSGTWTQWLSDRHSGGKLRYSASKGSKVTFSFTGTGFNWYAPKWERGGKANVYIDGSLARTVSLYSAERKYQQIAFQRTGLSATATHTVTIEVLRAKDSASLSYWVPVDALKIQSGTLVRR